MADTVSSVASDTRAITEWNPEDPKAWSSRQAWLTLWVTTFSLILGFMVWYMVSVIAPMLQNGGIVDKSHAFWLTAMPGLAGGLLRLVWMFFPPILGTKKMVAWSTVALILPMAGWLWLLMGIKDGWAPSFGLMIVLALLTGIGGGIFSGYMPSTSYFFPKAKQGVALGLQAGIGNFGVAVVQLLTPILVTVAVFGTSRGLGQGKKADGSPKPIVYLQTAPAFVIILLIIAAVLAFVLLKSVPIKANFRQQVDIFGNKHTWLMTLIYLLTFGCFSGLAGVFGLMLNNMVLHVPTLTATGPLAATTIAFLGALTGSASRVIFGPLCDKFGGAIWTLVSALGIAVSAVIVIIALSQTKTIDPLPKSGAMCTVSLPMFLTGMLLLFFFAGVGNAATFKQMPMIFPPRQAGGVIGWTAAIAAFGPFIFSVAINALTGAGTGAAKTVVGGANFGTHCVPVFVAVLILALVCAVIDWWFYARPGAEAKS